MACYKTNGALERNWFRNHGFEKMTWKDTYHVSEKIQFLQTKTYSSCDECGKRLFNKDLISIGTRQIHARYISGVDKVHYKCYHEGDCFGRWNTTYPSITEIDGYDQLSSIDKQKWVNWSIMLPKPPPECECLQNFKQNVINFDWKGAADHSSLTIKMFINIKQNEYNKHNYHLREEVEKVGGKCEWMQQGCQNLFYGGNIRRSKKHVFSCIVTIYSTCRDKLFKNPISCGTVANFMIIGENALYFILKELGIPD
eukprot:312084_1